MIYLDYCANTPVDSEVLETFIQTEKNYFGNPNAAHLAGESAREKMAEVTDSIASLLAVLPSEIIYTSGASEANNLAIKGIASTQKKYGKHIVSTELEHSSVREPLAWLQTQGYEIEMVDVGENGKIKLDHLKELIRDDTILVAVTAVDSELGTVQPVMEISEVIKEYPNCRLHVDATQAIGKIPFSFDGIDTVSFSAHKFYGLNGSGVLFKRKGMSMEPLIHGGMGATLYRSGTPTLALAAALEKALSKSIEMCRYRNERVRLMNKRIREMLKQYPLIRFNSPEDAVPYILNVSVSGMKGTRMQKMLSERGICVSVKSACSSDGEPSKAVFAVSHDRKNALSSWRISLSHLTTENEITEFFKEFEALMKENRS